MISDASDTILHNTTSDASDTVLQVVQYTTSSDTDFTSDTVVHNTTTSDAVLLVVTQNLLVV